MVWKKQRQIWGIAVEVFTILFLSAKNLHVVILDSWRKIFSTKPITSLKKIPLVSE